ncbi:NAD-P-binding protein [Pilatotrama ljubarskyi]|nr:NAD-P-binding protein [Pilatotrama ljubarskyi]
MPNEKPLVLVLGATGFTGRSIVNGLLDSENFRVAALMRPASISKPAVQEFRNSGVEIRVGDLTDDSSNLKEFLVGVDILISAVSAWSLEDQKGIFRAAKEVGIKRVVPCDFATPGDKGVRQLHDEKLAIRDFIKELGVPYTFIDVGWWMQLSLPLPSRSKASRKESTYELHGDGTKKMLVTDLRHIGAYVARIIADPRTLNQAVIVWEDEVTELQAREIGERASGEADVLKAKRIHLSAEDILKRVEEGKAELARDPNSFMGHVKVINGQYMYSIHVLGENTLENAKRLGYLDARELYPDMPKHTLEEFAKYYYSLEEPGQEYMRG